MKVKLLQFADNSNFILIYELYFAKSTKKTLTLGHKIIIELSRTIFK